MKLTISIVTYQSDLPLLEQALESIKIAFKVATEVIPTLSCHLYLIDNHPDSSTITASKHILAEFDADTALTIDTISSNKNSIVLMRYRMRETADSRRNPSSK